MMFYSFWRPIEYWSTVALFCRLSLVTLKHLVPNELPMVYPWWYWPCGRDGLAKKIVRTWEVTVDTTRIPIWLYWIFMVITIVFMGVSIINHNLTITGSVGSLQSPARWVVPPVLGICRSIEFTVEPTLAQLVGPHKLHASDEKIPISWCSTWKCIHRAIARTQKTPPIWTHFY